MEVNIPEIRLEGFTEPWQHRKLHEIFDIGTGYTPSKSNPAYWEDGTVPWIRMEDIRKNGRILSDSIQHVTPAAVKNKLIPAYSILISTTATIGEHALIIADSLANQQFTFITINVNCLKGINPYFVFFVCYKLADWCRANTNSGGLLAVDMDGFRNWKFSFPCMEEQDKISKFLMGLYNSIEFNKKKLDGLKQLKKGYLQQMFPQTGETMPRVRFNGFTEPWEICKLGDVIERVKGNDGRMDLPTLTISAGSGWLDQRDRFSANIAGKEQENYTLLSKGELSYNKGNSKLAKYGVVFELRTHEEALVPRVYHSFRETEKSNSSFLEYMFATKSTDVELSKLITSSARMDGLLNIGYEAFTGISICIPKKPEQIVIGDFFQNLDNQITTQTQKVQELKQLKAAYLQKMLV